MSKPVLTYVGHSYHRKTSSTVFLLGLLQEHYDLRVIWDESWLPSGHSVDAAQINASGPSVVLFFQTLPARQELCRIHCRQIFFIPMHDNVVGTPTYPWPRLRSPGVRVINFCRETHRFFTNLRIESLCVQYWPPPKAAAPPTTAPPKIFFWARKQEIGWQTLKHLLGTMRPERIILRAAPDPGQRLDMPGEDDIRDYHIEIVDGWLDKDRYLDLLTSCNIFMAPRLYEGIGQSFLEAMTLGMAVIAADLPTMNEYIRHGRNGYLYSPSTPTPLDFSALDTVRAQALQDVTSGHLNWLRQQKEILAYLASKGTLATRLRSWLWRLVTRYKTAHA